MRTLAVILSIATIGFGVSGCGSSGPKIDQIGSYEGPPVRFEVGLRSHVAVFTAPTAGWSARLDQVRRRFARAESFVTLVRPPDDAMVAQVQVDLHVETRISLEENIEVYARIVEYHGAESGGPYRLAGSTEGAP